MKALCKGRYVARIAQGNSDLRDAQRLRWLCFVGARRDMPPPAQALDADEFDAHCTHVLIREHASGQLVACFRMLTLAHGAEIGRSYSARYYDLSHLCDFGAAVAEIGRFCIHPGWRDPDILRLAWGVLARHVDAEGLGMLFGCSSFTGTEAQGYADSFALLRERHLAPARWLPQVKAPDVFRFAHVLRQHQPDPRRGMAMMPPLLRSYLAMGGWVSDHAVIDHQLDTLHVFTGLEISAIPPARARLLRALGADATFALARETA